MELTQTQYSQCVSFLRSVGCTDEQHQADIIGQAWERAIRGASRGASLFTRIYGALRHTHIDHWRVNRKPRVKNPVSGQPAVFHSLNVLTSGTDDEGSFDLKDESAETPFEAFLSTESAQTVQTLLDSFGEEERAILAFLQAGMGQVDIAHQMGTSQPTIHRRIGAMKAAIKAALKA